MEEKFYRKNDIGVTIEYYVIGEYINQGKKYRIYTDFVTDESTFTGIRLFVDLMIDNENYVVVEGEEKRRLLEEFHSEILNYTQQKEG
ncbi:MAG: hypothetical protein J6X28_02625 [Bacilli bacterium]|nr:hypothetical protein [Bacilli bacterium]